MAAASRHGASKGAVGMNVREPLLKVYWSMRGVIAPTLRYSQYAYEELLTREIHRDTRWLDLGCGHQVLPAWMLPEEQRLVSTCSRVVGLDYDWPSLLTHRSIRHRLRGDMARLPFRDGSFNLVTANMVVEHLDDPDLQFREVSRVLAPGGKFIFHTPNAHSYGTLMTRLVPGPLRVRLATLLDGRPMGDVFPAYYRANSRRRVEALGLSTGLRVALTLLLTDAIFECVPPLAFLELLWLRLLMTRPLEAWRTTIMAVMTKPHDEARSSIVSGGVAASRAGPPTK
jgi:SAM-dependent methyltransferase